MRFKTIKNVLDKSYDTLPLTGVYAETLGMPEANGLWLIYGAEKHGKTTVSLIMANMLSELRKTAYVQAEQGLDKDFQDTLKRLSISPKKGSLLFEGYVPITTIDQAAKKRNQPDIYFLDNSTVYAAELKGQTIQNLIRDNPNKLFILIAHEENGAPYPACAKQAKRLAKRIIRVEGNRATVEGRASGGHLIIDEEKAQLYWGTTEQTTETICNK